MAYKVEKKTSIKESILSILLFAPLLFAMSTQSYISTWSVLMLLFGLIFFYQNRRVIFKDKVVLTLVVLLAGYFMSTLISNTLAGWPKLTIRAFEIDIKHFLVIFWLIAIYSAKNNWIWFYRSIPCAGILIGINAIEFFYTYKTIYSVYSHSTYNPIFYGSVASILSFLIIQSYKLASWNKLFNKKIVLAFYSISFCLSSFAAIASMSRGAWLIYCVLLIVSFLYAEKKTKFFSIVIAFTFVLSFLILAQFNKPSINEITSRFNLVVTEIDKYFDSKNKIRSYEQLGSVDFRLEMYSAVFKALKLYPIFGAGSGYGKNTINHLADQNLIHPMLKTSPSSLTNLHNYFLSTLVDKGLFGLFFLVSIFIYLGYFFYCHLYVNRNLAMLGLLHTIGFFVMCLTSDPLNFHNPSQLFLPLVFIYVVHLRYLRQKK